MPDRAAIPAGSTGIAETDGFAIGALGADEADACAAIFERAFNAGHPYAARPVTRADFLAAVDGRDVLVARLAGGAPAGFAAVVRGHAFIHHLYVDPDFAGRGIGRALLARAVALAGGAATLKCQLGNPRALAFYRRLGWTEGERGGEAPFEWVRLAAP
jgi:ribosomal protein S18 acetylase RimI-like enzyme